MRAALSSPVLEGRHELVVAGLLGAIRIRLVVKAKRLEESSSWDDAVSVRPNTAFRGEAILP
jgi:hypothetical protein